MWRAADLVVFLDVPRRVSLVRCARRNAPYLFRSRPDLPERCPEVLIIPKLLKIIWQFPTHVRPQLLADFTGDRRHALVRLRTREDFQAFRESVGY